MGLKRTVANGLTVRSRLEFLLIVRFGEVTVA